MVSNLLHIQFHDTHTQRFRTTATTTSNPFLEPVQQSPRKYVYPGTEAEIACLATLSGAIFQCVGRNGLHSVQ